MFFLEENALGWLRLDYLGAAASRSISLGKILWNILHKFIILSTLKKEPIRLLETLQRRICSQSNI